MRPSRVESISTKKMDKKGINDVFEFCSSRGKSLTCILLVALAWTSTKYKIQSLSRIIHRCFWEKLARVRAYACGFPYSAPSSSALGFSRKAPARWSCVGRTGYEQRSVLSWRHPPCLGSPASFLGLA